MGMDAGKSVWGSGYLPSVYQGVQCRSEGEPVLYLSDPAGVNRTLRRRSLDALERINQKIAGEVGDPETITRTSRKPMPSSTGSAIAANSAARPVSRMKRSVETSDCGASVAVIVCKSNLTKPVVKDRWERASGVHSEFRSFVIGML